MAIQEGFSANFHPDEKKQTDVVEKLVEKLGPDDAFDVVMEQLERDPENPEFRRQANLLVNRLDDLVSRLKEKISH